MASPRKQQDENPASLTWYEKLNLGDLVPCDENDAEFRIVILAIEDGKTLHKYEGFIYKYEGNWGKIASFGGGYNDANFYPSKRSEPDYVLNGQEIVAEPETNPDSVEIDLDWEIKYPDKTSCFKNRIIIQPGNTGIIKLDEHKSLNWTFLPVRENGE